MFKKVIGYPGFWKSVVLLGVIYMSVLMAIQWAFTGFSSAFFTSKGPLVIILVFVVGSFVCGFSVSYARFWARLSREKFKK